MGDEILKWFSAGVVAAGVTAAMFAGAGVAIADDGSGSTSNTASTSETSKSAESAEDSVAGEPDTTDPEETDVTEPEIDVDLDEEEPAEEPVVDLDEEEPADEPDVDTDTDTDADAEAEKQAAVDVVDDRSDSDLVDTTPTAQVEQPGVEPVEDLAAETEPEDTVVAEDDAEEPTEPDVAPLAQQRAMVVVDNIVEDIAAKTKDAGTVEAITFAAAAPVASTSFFTDPLTTLLDFVGTVVFGLYHAVTRLVGGPAMLPLGSTVTVRSSTLRLDCGCAPGEGFHVPADWYFPAGYEENPPDRMIYLQHGFLASGPWYSYTAAALATQTNSIVLTPSITSNFLAADACWLGAPPMHKAIADLFNEDNDALADSAARAGYDGPIPDRVVLMGHSLGGGAVSGAAGYMVDNGTADRLAGVVLLDGVGLDDSMTDALRKVPLDIPIYQIAAPRYFWNQFGVGSAALMAARPGQFVGVTLEGGSHVDAMRGGNPLIQFSQQVVAGFSQPRNVAAARHLMVTWANDMFAGNQATGVYDLAPGERLNLRTPGGVAVLVALPNPLTKLFLFNLLQPLVALGDGIFRFDPACVSASVGAAAGASCSDSIAA
ncbi:alpha/beta hydrolase [Mycolicibacterium elephantis]|uniref:alpha/beta hydrolase n=1 Tax=Mycolicibacterium elephantis TaxID=81858 RepID=UPI003A89FA16